MNCAPQNLRFLLPCKVEKVLLPAPPPREVEELVVLADPLREVKEVVLPAFSPHKVEEKKNFSTKLFNFCWIARRTICDFLHLIRWRRWFTRSSTPRGEKGSSTPWNGGAGKTTSSTLQNGGGCFTGSSTSYGGGEQKKISPQNYLIFAELRAAKFAISSTL